ncbi:MAG TPA: YeeE/YedE family protein [Kofleriaceae bacterium]|nr:YeeE/YedE family protein [Kofleriaceae bacterium]
MRCRIVAFVALVMAGLLFGGGLLVSGMTRPAKVVGFLDPAHHWDPSLAFVIVGAIAVYAIAQAAIRRRRNEPWFDVKFHVPTRKDIDPQLILGAALFGIGWALGGLCPGPALVSAASGGTSALLFVAAMFTGMWLHARSNP